MSKGRYLGFGGWKGSKRESALALRLHMTCVHSACADSCGEGEYDDSGLGSQRLLWKRNDAREVCGSVSSNDRI